MRLIAGLQTSLTHSRPLHTQTYTVLMFLTWRIWVEPISENLARAAFKTSSIPTIIPTVCQKIREGTNSREEEEIWVWDRHRGRPS
jgi:hypothetical protein